MARQPYWQLMDIDIFDTNIDNYFAKCEETGLPPTIERLALELNIDYMMLNRYHNEYNNYSDDERDKKDDTYPVKGKYIHFCEAIKKSYDLVRAKDIERLKIRGIGGDIFIAKNWGYTDVQDVNLRGKMDNTNINADITNDVDFIAEMRAKYLK